VADATGVIGVIGIHGIKLTDEATRHAHPARP
jgi:hypothetical protein